jgi:hypothetical protein
MKPHDFYIMTIFFHPKKYVRNKSQDFRQGQA